MDERKHCRFITEEEPWSLQDVDVDCNERFFSAKNKQNISLLWNWFFALKHWPWFRSILECVFFIPFSVLPTPKTIKSTFLLNNYHNEPRDVVVRRRNSKRNQNRWKRDRWPKKVTIFISILRSYADRMAKELRRNR